MKTVITGLSTLDELVTLFVFLVESRNKPIQGALPTENMPKKSIEASEVKERTIIHRTFVAKEKSFKFKTLYPETEIATRVDY